MVLSRKMSFRAFHSHRGMLCEPLHEHLFEVTVSIAGTPNEEGFVADFRAIKRVFQRLVVQELDGRNLDDLFEYPTSENLCRWIWEKLDDFFPLYAIEVQEKAHSRAIYFGPKGHVGRC